MGVKGNRGQQARARPPPGVTRCAYGARVQRKPTAQDVMYRAEGVYINLVIINVSGIINILYMNPNDLKKLEEYQKEIARLQAGIAKMNRKLLALPGRFGFKSMDDFIGALRSAQASGGTVVARARRRRAVITDEVKAKVKSLLGQDKTGAEVAKAVGISLPSVQNIKKELGLVKKRKG